MRSRRTATTLVAAGLALLASVVAAWTVFACTLLPSVNLNQAYGTAGADILLTGSTWTIQTPVVVHWDTLSGPVLATVEPVPGTAVIGPVTIHIPASAQPGYHVLIATDNTYSSSTARVPFQVTAAGSSAGAPPPGVVLSTGDNSAPSGVGVGVLALIAAAGAGGLAVAGAGVAGVVRGRPRQRVEVPARTPRQR